MRIVVVGATGHIGSYLVPRLVSRGHDVVALSRGLSAPYVDDPAFAAVERVEVDREAEDAAGAFGRLVAGLRPDVVIDLICFEPDSARQLVEALRGSHVHLIHCGTIWVHGAAREVPVREDAPRRPFGKYGVDKEAIERLLLDGVRAGGIAVTVLHPGHIVGPGWVPINPAGNLNLDVFERLAAGERVLLPNVGLETLHHVHADDVAQAFDRAVDRRAAAIGESFHVTSERAITLRGYAEAVAGWYGQEPNLELCSWESFREHVGEPTAEATWDHIAHSPSMSIDKARALLGYAPRYRSLEAVREAVEWLAGQGRLPQPTAA
jgi:nucleoside-diphosphate-sugar epimerase